MHCMYILCKVPRTHIIIIVSVTVDGRERKSRLSFMVPMMIVIRAYLLFDTTFTF